MIEQLFKTKSPEQFDQRRRAPDRKMKRTLTALDLTALGIGAIIGGGHLRNDRNRRRGSEFSEFHRYTSNQLYEFLDNWLPPCN